MIHKGENGCVQIFSRESYLMYTATKKGKNDHNTLDPNTRRRANA